MSWLSEMFDTYYANVHVNVDHDGDDDDNNDRLDSKDMLDTME